MDKALKTKLEKDLKEVETKFLRLKRQYDQINEELFRLQGEQRVLLGLLEEKKEEPKKGGK